MSEVIAWEGIFFLRCFLSGILMICFYDMIRIVRRIISHNIFAVAVEDILYWVLCGIFIFLLLYHGNGGTIRWFAIAGVMIGMLVYNLTISRYFVKYVSGLINGMIRLTGKVLGFVFGPFFKVAGGIKRVLGKKYKKVLKYTRKGLKKSLKKFKIVITKH